MRIRSAERLVLACGILGLTLGCSQQPTSPSGVVAPAAIAAVASGGSQQASLSTQRFGKRETGVVYVTSQGLYYDTFVVKDPLPMNGRFQLLANGETEFGPGQPGYLGGRWWEDTNGNQVQDAEDHFFLCPLLPPGRPTP